MLFKEIHFLHITTKNYYPIVLVGFESQDIFRLSRIKQQEKNEEQINSCKYFFKSIT